MLHALTVVLALASPQSPLEPSGSAAATPRAPQELAREIRHIPIHEWIAPSAPPSQPPLGSFLGDERSGEPMFLLGPLEEDHHLLDADQITELVRAFAPIDLDDEDMSLDIDGAALRIAGPPDKVHLVEATVRQLRRAFVHELRIQAELFRLPTGDGDIPAVATAEQLRELRQRLQRIWTGQASGLSGSVLSLTKDRVVYYVHDVDVEVAQSARIGDVRVSTVFEGVRVAVEPHVLTDSADLVLYAQVAFGEQRQAMQSMSTGNREIPALDVPSVNCNSGTMSGRVADGGALLMSLRGAAAGGGQMLLALSVFRVAADDEPAQEVAVFPVSGLVSRALLGGFANRPDEDLQPSGNQVQLSRIFGGEQHLAPSDVDSLFELLQGALPLDEEDNWVAAMGGHIAVRGPSELRDGVRQVIRGLQDQWLSTARVDVRTSLRETHFGDAMFPRAGDPGPAPTPPLELHHLTFPALIGRAHTLVRGHETTTIRDYDVEIAQKSSISNPVVQRLFTGVVLSLSVFPQQTGFGADFELDLLDSGPTRHRMTDSKDGLDLYLPTLGRTRFSHGGAVPLGKDLDLGEGPTVRLGEQSFSTRQTIRVTR